MLVDASNRSNGFSVRCIRSDERTVTIGDTEWMLYNVADPGTVATALPSELSGTRAASHGKFYQWNRKVAWATTGNISDWNTSTPSGTSWYASNNPCPSGFVVPTKSQWEALINTCTKSYKGGWNSEDYGYMELINGSNKLEFPAVGSRSNTDGALYDVGTGGRYWTSESDGSNALHMYFISTNVGTNSANKGLVITYAVSANKSHIKRVSGRYYIRHPGSFTGLSALFFTKHNYDPGSGVYPDDITLSGKMPDHIPNIYNNL